MPLHTLGLFSFPRRISDYPVCYLNLSTLVFFGMIEGGLVLERFVECCGFRGVLRFVW